MTRTEDVEVLFLPSGRRVRVQVGTTLLEAARLAQLPIASACGADGVCADCGLEIVSGAAHLPEETERERAVKARNRVDPKLRLACRIPVTHALSATAPYW